MANTYTLISSNVLSSSAASVTFSAIPSTYTDLVLRCSTRADAGSAPLAIVAQFNADTATNYSYTTMYGSGTTVVSSKDSNVNVSLIGYSTGSGNTSNTFSNNESYIPSYLASQNKPMGNFSAQENNTTAAYISAPATLWRNTAAITSIKLYITSGANFDTGSSFYLYGIKNS